MRAVLILVVVALLVAVQAQRRPARRPTKNRNKTLVLPTHSFMCKKLGEPVFIQNQINCSYGDRSKCDARFSDVIRQLILRTVTTGTPIQCKPTATNDCKKAEQESQKIYFVMKEIHRVYPERFWCLVDRHVRSQNAVSHISEVRRKMLGIHYKCENLPDNYEKYLQDKSILSELTTRCPPRFQLDSSGGAPSRTAVPGSVQTHSNVAGPVRGPPPGAQRGGLPSQRAQRPAGQRQAPSSLPSTAVQSQVLTSLPVQTLQNQQQIQQITNSRPRGAGGRF